MLGALGVMKREISGSQHLQMVSGNRSSRQVEQEHFGFLAILQCDRGGFLKFYGVSALKCLAVHRNVTPYHVDISASPGRDLVSRPFSAREKTGIYRCVLVNSH